VKEDVLVSSIAISRKVFEVLVKHLVDIEEKQVQLLDKYYPDITKEREAFEDLLNVYIKKIEGIICNAEVLDGEADKCPFIIIGSIVELENIDYNEIERYHIISPFESGIYSHIDFASFLSPVGKALLLKEVEDEISIENPMGHCTYIIRSINIPDEMFSYIGKDG
jgi:transcription elongation factor GreA